MPHIYWLGNQNALKPLFTKEIILIAVICNLCVLGNYCHLCSFARAKTAASTRMAQKDPVVRAEMKDCIAETNASAAQMLSCVKITKTG